MKRRRALRLALVLSMLLYACAARAEENACAHENIETWEDVVGTYASVDDQAHEVTGNRYRFSSCTDCGAGLGRVLLEEGVTFSENHHYYRYNEETGRDDYVGVCETCGHENACTHENAEHWTDVVGEAMSINDKEHSVTGEKVEVMHCPDCDVGIDVYTGETTTITENHYYYRHNDETGRDEYVGVCERCGHENACTHEDADHWTDVDGESTSLNDKEHSVTGEKVE